MTRARCLDRRARVGLVVGIFLAALLGVLLTPRIPLGAGYHDFADRRTLLGIPNCLDVLSNLPFLVVGLWGAVWIMGAERGLSFRSRWERLPYLVFFGGVALTGIGSLWYHLSPGNSRLPWDLLPMTFSFTSMVVAVIMERISLRAGMLLYLPLLAAGAGSVVYWQLTEAQGRGDYRFYLFVQFFSPVLLAAMVWLFAPRYSGTGYLVFAFALFVLAKAMEALDGQIYAFTGCVSGHALKHATAGVACYFVLLMLQRRRPVSGVAEIDPESVSKNRGAALNC